MKRGLDERLRRAVGPQTQARIKRFSYAMADVEFVLLIGLVFLFVTHHRALAIGWACAMGGGGALVMSLGLDRILKKPYDVRGAVRDTLAAALLFGGIVALLVSSLGR